VDVTPVLRAGDVKVPELEIHLVPAQRHELAHAQPMSIRQQYQRGIPVAVPAQPAGSGHELLNLVGRQVLPAAAVAVRNADWRRDFPIFDDWLLGRVGLNCMTFAMASTPTFPLTGHQDRAAAEG
jgi:hypothetical protein